MCVTFDEASLVTLRDISCAVRDETSERGGVSPMALTLSKYQTDVQCDVAEFVRIQLALTIV